MTEILERDECDGLEPDMWAGIHRHYDPRPAMELERLQREFFERGGVATWLPPKKAKEEIRQGDYYAFMKPVEKPKNMGHVGSRKMPGDELLVLKVEHLLSTNPPASRRQLALAIESSDNVTCRILDLYFKEDPRANAYRYKGSQRAIEAEIEDRKLAELLSLCFKEMGLRTIKAAADYLGVSSIALRRVRDKYLVGSV